MTKVIFSADKVKIKTGHRVDGTAEITFEVGEYMVENILPLSLLNGKVLNVEVKEDGE